MITAGSEVAAEIVEVVTMRELGTRSPTSRTAHTEELRFLRTLDESSGAPMRPTQSSRERLRAASRVRGERRLAAIVGACIRRPFVSTSVSLEIERLEIVRSANPGRSLIVAGFDVHDGWCEAVLAQTSEPAPP